MNEEVKEAIRNLKHYISITPHWKQKEYTSSEVDNYIKITLNYIDKLQKEVKEKDKKWKDRIKDSIIAYELSEKINFDKPDNSRIIEALKILLEGETDE